MAATNQISFNVSDALTSKGKIEAKAQEIDTIMKEVKSTMDSVKPWWKGDAVNKFTAQYDKIEKDVKQLIESVNTIGKQLESQAKAQQEEDAAIAQQLNK